MQKVRFATVKCYKVSEPNNTAYHVETKQQTIDVAYKDAADFNRENAGRFYAYVCIAVATNALLDWTKKYDMSDAFSFALAKRLKENGVVSFDKIQPIRAKDFKPGGRLFTEKDEIYFSPGSGKNALERWPGELKDNPCVGNACPVFYTRPDEPLALAAFHLMPGRWEEKEGEQATISGNDEDYTPIK